MNINTDVLIVGTGVSGLFAALNLNSNLKVTMITKAELKESNTYLAQGGISTARTLEDIPLFVEDTLKAGKFKNDIDAVTVLAQESLENIKQIIDLGVKLDRNQTELSYTREAAHSINRIVHSKDETGKAVIDALALEAINRTNITIFENTYMVDLLCENNTCYGAVALKNNEQLNIHAKVVILATGGIGGLFKNSTNQRHLTGDGIYVAIKNNVELKNLEFIQFHPTAFYDGNNDKKRFLISESVRGEGAKLVNCYGERFVDELLPRDVVSEAIKREMEKTGKPNVYLDATALPGDYIKSRFPKIYSNCLSAGFDMSKDLIPVSPAQHYFMGGIAVNLNSKTSMNNLYAVGEVTCTGVHGANRLASNSLMEGLVFSRRAALTISEEINNITLKNIEPPMIIEDEKTIEANHLNTVIKMFRGKVGNFTNELVDSR
jgi:L-aspartate oxidase